MSETLSYQPETTTETVPDNLTPEEQDSLAVGEKLQADQEQLLAGKYKDAQELEKAYVELQKKLGEKEQATETEQATEEQPEDKPQLSEGASLITPQLVMNTMLMVTSYQMKQWLSSHLCQHKI